MKMEIVAARKFGKTMKVARITSLAKQFYRDKPLSGAWSHSCKPESVQQQIAKYKTANWFLRQGDDQVNKRIKQKNVFKQFLFRI